LAVYNRRNINSVWKKISETPIVYNTLYDDVVRHCGLEKLKLFAGSDQGLSYTATRRLDNDFSIVEYGMIGPIPYTPVWSELIDGNCGKTDETNWVIFENNEHAHRFIQSWYPLRIGSAHSPPIPIILNKFTQSNQTDYSSHRGSSSDMDDDGCMTFILEKTIETPPIFQTFRGSTNACRIGTELWFICHSVSYETRRYYYHVVVILDSETLELKRYSIPFTFEGSPVEHCCGFININTGGDDGKDGGENELIKPELLIGYTIMDRKTKYIQCDPKITFSFISCV